MASGAAMDDDPTTCVGALPAAGSEAQDRPMSVFPSGEQFEIVAGDHRATLVEVGGGIRDYTYGGRIALDGYPSIRCVPGPRHPLILAQPARRRQLRLRGN